MKPAGKICFFLLLTCSFWAARAGSSNELKAIAGAELVPTEWADGDSFLVRFADPDTGATREEVFRLYGVDCAETLTERESDRRRLLEQARHFGVKEPGQLVEQGRSAKTFVQKALAKPFTVYSAFAQAEGRSARPRLYSFVVTDDGRDLAALLVENGLARVKGIVRETPEGTPRDEYSARLADLELTAAMKRAGIWSLSDPARLAVLRAEERREEQTLAAIQGDSGPPSEPLDINTASKKDLQRLPGVGEILAERILDGRPFRSLEDLQRVKGIGKGTLEKLKPFLQVSQPNDGRLKMQATENSSC